MLVLDAVIQATWGDPPAQLLTPPMADPLSRPTYEQAAAIAARSAAYAPHSDTPASPVGSVGTDGLSPAEPAPASHGSPPDNAVYAPPSQWPGSRSLPATVEPVVDAEFWEFAIATTRAVAPGFVFLADADAGTERRLLDLGFDFVTDHRLYDCLRGGGDADAVRAHLAASAACQARLARFVETHDEERALAAMAPPRLLARPPDDAERQRAAFAAVVVTLAAPGLRLVHDGQMEGRVVHHSLHEVRAPMPGGGGGRV